MKLFGLIFLFFSAALAFSQETPEPAFGFLSAYPHVRDFTLSSTQDEAYFTVQNPNEEIAVITCIRLKDGQWTSPEIVPFTGTYRDIEPCLSPDGLQLYFSSDRPVSDTASARKDYDIWYVERKDPQSSWSKPANLGAPVNTIANEFYPSLARNGNLYFTSDALTLLNKDDLYFSAWDGRKFSAPVPLPGTVNSAGYEFNAYVSPDESFLIYTAYGRKDGLGSGDLYISRKDAKGQWKEAVNLGETINSPYMDYCPFVDPETNMLYFTSKRSTIIPQSFASLEDFLREANRYENGLSRIYRVQLKK